MTNDELRMTNDGITELRDYGITELRDYGITGLLKLVIPAKAGITRGGRILLLVHRVSTDRCCSKDMRVLLRFR